jgi:hypothetical protein
MAASIVSATIAHLNVVSALLRFAPRQAISVCAQNWRNRIHDVIKSLCLRFL